MQQPPITYGVLQLGCLFVGALMFQGSLFCQNLSVIPNKADSSPQFLAGAPSYLLPYAVPVDFQHLEKTLKVRAQVNGGPVGEFTVDTGSVGMILSADDVPHIDPDAKPGKITYSSSGVELRGVWTTAVVTFPEAKGVGGVATALVPVLAVTSEVCTGEGVNAAGCHASAHPHPHMLGVGFGRGTEGHPEKNAFLNLKEMRAGEMRRGYVVTALGIVLGLSAESVSAGFLWQKLTERSVSEETVAMDKKLKDWETEAGTFEVEGKKAGEGKVLMDTGLTNMMLAATDGPGHGDVPDGTTVTVKLLEGQVSYSFKVGDLANPTTPRRVSWVAAKHGTYVNTGLRALAGFDYLFDAEGGWLGLKSRE